MSPYIQFYSAPRENIQFSNLLTLFFCGSVAQWLALWYLNKKVLGLILESGQFRADFACSPCVCMASPQVLRLPPTVQQHSKSVFGELVTLNHPFEWLFASIC